MQIACFSIQLVNFNAGGMASPPSFSSGKAWTTHGGQNPVEPILAGKPVVFGPHMENFATLARTLVSHSAAMQVSDIDSLGRTVAELLRDSEARQRLVQNAHAALSEHKGATARTAEVGSRLPRETIIATSELLKTQLANSPCA